MMDDRHQLEGIMRQVLRCPDIRIPYIGGRATRNNFNRSAFIDN